MNASSPTGRDVDFREAILAFLRNVVEEELELGPEQIAQIGLDTPIVEGLQLDSVTQVVLLTAIEEEYDFLFAYEDRERLETIQDLVEMIEERSERRGNAST